MSTFFGALGKSRTYTEQGLNLLPLPVGLRGLDLVGV